MSRKLLGQSLLEAVYISREQLNYALALKEEQHNQKLGRILVNLKYVDEDILIVFLGMQYGTRSIYLCKEDIDDKMLSLIPKHIAERYDVIPVGFQSEGRTRKLVVAMSDPLNLQVIDNVSFLTGYMVEPVFAREEDLKWGIKYYYNKARVLINNRSH